MIVDENGTFKTQRQYSRMALIKVSIDGNFLVLDYASKPSLKVPIDPSGLSLKECR